MSDTREEAERVMRQADCLYDSIAVAKAFDEMAQRINADFAVADALVISIMNGGLIASGQLLPRLTFPLLVDYIHASRYRERTHGDELHWRVEPAQALNGKDVLIIDDILDEGHTLEAIIDFCHRHSPASVRSAVLIEKVHERGVRPPVEYIGLRVPDRYVFGFGMDYKGYWRNAPGIFAVSE